VTDEDQEIKLVWFTGLSIRTSFRDLVNTVMNTTVGCKAWIIFSKRVAVAVCYYTIGFMLFEIEDNFLNSVSFYSAFFVLKIR